MKIMKDVKKSVLTTDCVDFRFGLSASLRVAD